MKPLHIKGHYVQFSGERELMSVHGPVVGREVTVTGQYPMKFQTERRAFTGDMKRLRSHILFHINHVHNGKEWVKR